MKRFRLPLIGCLGALGLAAILVLIVFLSRRSGYESALARWNAKGGSDYTLVVSQYCFCGLTGEYKITVKGGRVTDFEPVGSAVGPTGSGSTGIVQQFKPSDFDRMTAGAMLAQAGRNQRDLWLSPLFSRISIEYDPTYGYVTEYHSDMNGEIDYLLGRYVTDSGYSYAAHDLALDQP